ncbi:Alpha/beta hydrolase family protein [Pseudomonas reidholzensis]|uniref:Alpha/beta hydrolase family protein n=2 Tax=Pseudomonas reidholzensis TaxID=1785162 RepID=A0A383RT28_9PSED|nr:Alpha/beta hydrolase family protein [Pseudomonas reidholzensis]
MTHRCAGMPGFLLALGMLAIAGCQSPRENLETLAAAHGQRVEVLQTRDYPLAYSAARIPAAAPLLRVYLEGDGRAWATATQPSLDPSPRHLMLAQLAFDDPQPSVYLARPCQFVTAPGCTPAMWTARRFSPEVLVSLEQALDQLKRRYGNQAFELVGYSGGGALALLLAGRRDDVRQVQTLAGNLSPAEWARELELTPLQGSLEPLQYRQRLATIAQRHLLGGDDRQVPAAVAAYYRRQLGAASCAQFVSIAGASHEQGWAQAWQQWRSRPLPCANSQQ